MPTQYDALAYDDSDNDDDSDDSEDEDLLPESENAAYVPSFEDLSSVRTDETTVLEAIYGDDFSKKTSSRGFSTFRIRVRPPDLEPKKVGSELT